jgi:hypothetical protein
MPKSKPSADSKASLNWKDVVLRAVIPALLISLTGLVGEWAITSASSKAENARLVTNLQIQREQAETDLRKDIFGQAVAALIGESADQGEIEDYSKRLLKLELLALNFGDSILLSPLFSEFEKDLNRHRAAEPADSNSALALRDRLRSLAQRVASTQLSFLAQRGASIPIQVPLITDGDGFCNGEAEYKWPNDNYTDLKPCIERTPSASTAASVVYDGETLTACPEEGDGKYIYIPVDQLKQLLLDTASVTLDKPGAEERYVTAVFSEPKPERKSVRVSLEVCPRRDTPGCDPEDVNTVERSFTLDYFNFPTIDNTRLPNNDRFAVVLDDFALDDSTKDPCASMLNLSVALFPSEYASLRDRPTMRESLELLERAQEHSLEDSAL